MKQLIFILLTLIIIACPVFADEPPDFLEDTTEDDTTEPEEVNPNDQDAMETLGAEVEQTDAGVEYNVQEANDFTVPSSDQSISWQTNQGPIADFSLNNALFSAGNLVQASLVSFSNANPLSFQSIFDSSLFQLTLNEEDEAQIAQTNGFGELGYTYITTSGGNLTQDGVIVFLPEGDNPTYIYYNTTEVEFEDGTVYFFNEVVTNTDNTKDATTVEFNENGFTKVQIQPENNYTIGDYTFTNNEEDPIMACKDDSTCEIDIDVANGIFEINGEVEVYSNDELIIESIDSNNNIIFSEESNLMSFENTNPREEVLANVYCGYHKIVEAKDSVYSEIVAEEKPVEFLSYESLSNGIVYTVENGVLVYGTMRIIPPEAREYGSFWASIAEYKYEFLDITGRFFFSF